MEWTARHSDGFTERSLRYTVHCVDGVAELEAGWFRRELPPGEFRTLFAINDAPVSDALPALRTLDERYEAGWDDLDTQILVVESGGVVIRRRIYGCDVLLRDRPELLPFLELFRWLEGLVLAHLPPGLCDA